MLLRHAKSSWDDPELDDHERPLARRGTRDAPNIGAFINKHQLHPDLIVCSDAVRARATLALVLSKLDADQPEVVFEPLLYLAEPEKMLEVIATLDASAQQVLMIGHNPGMHALALGLVGAGESKGLTQLAIKFPTAALAVIEFDADTWADLQSGRGRLRAFVTPNMLKA